MFSKLVLLSIWSKDFVPFSLYCWTPAPFLSIIFLHLIKKKKERACPSQQEGFRFHPKCSLQGITHLAFADDVLLLSRGDSSSVLCLLQQLTLFGRISGLDINP
jgi:hypothetical protein